MYRNANLWFFLVQVFSVRSPFSSRIMGLKAIAVDGGAAKAESTKSIGAESHIDFMQERDLIAAVKKATNGGAHVVIVFSPSPQACAAAPSMLRRRGTTWLLSVFVPDQLQLPWNLDILLSLGLLCVEVFLGIKLM